MPGPSMFIPLPSRPPCSPYCDHAQGAVAVAPHMRGPAGVSAYDYCCGHCGKVYEYEVVSGEWYELDAAGKRVM